MPISVAHPSERLLPARVRVAIDALEVLRQRTGSPGVWPRHRDAFSAVPASTCGNTSR